MKKFIAGIVMCALLFMALAVPAFAGSKSYDRNGGNSEYKTSSKDYKGNSSCVYWENLDGSTPCAN